MTYQFNVEDKWYFFADEIRSVSGELNVINDVSINGNLKAEDTSLNNLDISGSLKVSNGSSVDASDGDVLTISGGQMKWLPPSPAFTFYQFKATGSAPTSGTYFDVNKGSIGAYPDPQLLEYSNYTKEFPVGSTSDIIYNTTGSDYGKFTINLAGTYLIFCLISIQTNDVSVSAKHIKGYLEKESNTNTTTIISSDLYDNGSDVFIYTSNLNAIENFSSNDKLLIKGRVGGDNGRSDWIANSLTRLTMLKLS